MKVKIIGKKKTAFVDQNTNELKEYARIFYVYNAPASTSVNTFEGQCCSDKAVTVAQLDAIDVGDRLILDFDEKGRIIDLELIE